MLSPIFTAAQANARWVTRDPYLARLGPALADFDARLSVIPALAGYEKALAAIMKNPKFGDDGLLTNEFAQTLGEAQFMIMCHDRGVDLTRVPEVPKKKTPDFEASFGGQKVFLEVKTLSVVSGAIGIKAAQESSREASDDIEAQINRGERIAIGTSEAQPYGDKVERDKTILGVTNPLLEKVRGNIKADQFANPNTFLVLNLSIIPPVVTEPKVLRPAYPDDYLFPKAVTGELWMVAFGNTGMLVLGNPEFEGKPCVEGIFDKVGVLADSEYAAVAGLIFMIHPLSGPSQLYGLFRSADWNRWNDESPEFLLDLLRLTGANWNDCRDSNGWQVGRANTRQGFAHETPEPDARAEAMPTVHLHSQARWHDAAYISGNRAGLLALRQAIDDALRESQQVAVGLADVFANDGEGYDLHVKCVDSQHIYELALPYTDETAKEREVDAIWPWGDQGRAPSSPAPGPDPKTDQPSAQVRPSPP